MNHSTEAYSWNGRDHRSYALSVSCFSHIFLRIPLIRLGKVDYVGTTTPLPLDPGETWLVTRLLPLLLTGTRRSTPWMPV